MIITIEQLSQNFDSIHAAQVTAGKLMVRRATFMKACAASSCRFAAGDGNRTAFPFELTSGLQVQIFASADCDSLCAASILVHVLKREHILYGPRAPSAAALFRLCFFTIVLQIRDDARHVRRRPAGEGSQVLTPKPNAAFNSSRDDTLGCAVQTATWSLCSS